LHKYIANRLVAFERKALRKLLEAIKENENLRKRYNKELMQLFGDLDLDILSLVRISLLNWMGQVNGMDSKEKQVKYIFNNNPQGSRLREGPKNRWWNYKQVLINAKLQIGKGGQRAELTGRSPFRS